MDEKKELIIEIADYIIETETSLRKTALQFKLSKTTISKYMNEYLPKINMEKYQEVRKIIDINSDKLLDEDIERIETEYRLYLLGFNMQQISTFINNSYSQVQRDISDRLKKIDSKKSLEADQVKFNNIRSNERTLEEKQEYLKLIELEYQLVLKGYKLNEIATLVNSSSSSVQRDLRLLEIIDLKKYLQVKEQLQQNQKNTQIKGSGKS